MDDFEDLVEPLRIAVLVEYERATDAVVVAVFGAAVGQRRFRFLKRGDRLTGPVRDFPVEGLRSVVLLEQDRVGAVGDTAVLTVGRTRDDPSLLDVDVVDRL
ncbi:hypothetical protein [Natrinema pallidum]|uniref:Uncharacterized protein n=1 Tax=Natrinema pallidum TaxID=69527 RepID=A0A4P9TE86_9EURY|nr:hypothetical protein [Natrinema pallidum]QCW03086.1 hypothetical protein FGF80_07485 [Natrinema pallidum]